MRRTALLALTAFVVTSTAVAIGPMAPFSAPSTAVAAPPGDSTVVALQVSGVGYGHGRGMSQWGAYGRAVNGGQQWPAILAAYYGGTTQGTRSMPNLRVRLTPWDGAPHVGVISRANAARWQGSTTSYSSLLAIEVSVNVFDVYGTMGTYGCYGVDLIPWALLGDNVAGPITFTTTVNQATTEPGNVLGVCEPDGTVTHYRGAIEVRDDGGVNHAVNVVDAENYLRGVVPKEVPASWGSAGGGAGMHALRAQAVAARSYALAQNRYSYARTCDTPTCQVYGGSATRLGASTNGYVKVEHALTDQAIVDTATVVRVWPAGHPSAGAVVSTEFSSSNGPRTAGNTFPAVDDPWDDVPGNALHRWTRVIDADSVMAAYGLANANAVATVNDTSVSNDGIWDNKVVLGNGSSVSAWDFRNAFGLPSPGFTIAPIRRTLENRGGFAYIGDSIGVGVAGTPDAPLQAVLDGVYAPAGYDSLVSRRTQGGTIPDGVSAAAAVPVRTPLVVVELGYNDEPAQMAARIDAVMATLRSRQVRRVMWVTVSERNAKYAVTNQHLRAAEARWPELTVIDWNAASAGIGGDRWYSNDDVHLTATGRSEFALWLRSHLLGTSRRLQPGEVMRVRIAGRGGVPGGAEGVALNVTAVLPSAAGHLVVWPCGSAMPATSSVNFGAGGVEPNAVVVPLDATGEVCVWSLTETDVLVDVSAVLGSGVSAASSRLVDTRGSGRLAARQVLRVPVAGRGGVPGGAEGVALNVTAVLPSAAGHLVVWPCGSAMPATSSVNFGAGGVEPNAVVVPLDATGEVCVWSLTETDVLVDVSAVLGSGVSAASSRLVDTRGSGRLAARQVLRVPVAGRGGVPGDAEGVALNVTAVLPSAAGHLVVWPCGSAMPATSSVNFGAGGVEPNAVVVPLDATGEVCVWSLTETDVLVDVSAVLPGVSTASARLVDTRIGLMP